MSTDMSQNVPPVLLVLAAIIVCRHAVLLVTNLDVAFFLMILVVKDFDLHHTIIIVSASVVSWLYSVPSAAKTPSSSSAATPGPEDPPATSNMADTPFTTEHTSFNKEGSVRSQAEERRWNIPWDKPMTPSALRARRNQTYYPKEERELLSYVRKGAICRTELAYLLEKLRKSKESDEDLQGMASKLIAARRYIPPTLFTLAEREQNLVLSEAIGGPRPLTREEYSLFQADVVALNLECDENPRKDYGIEYEELKTLWVKRLKEQRDIRPPTSYEANTGQHAISVTLLKLQAQCERRRRRLSPPGHSGIDTRGTNEVVDVQQPIIQVILVTTTFPETAVFRMENLHGPLELSSETAAPLAPSCPSRDIPAEDLEVVELANRQPKDEATPQEDNVPLGVQSDPTGPPESRISSSQGYTDVKVVHESYSAVLYVTEPEDEAPLTVALGTLDGLEHSSDTVRPPQTTVAESRVGVQSSTDLLKSTVDTLVTPPVDNLDNQPTTAKYRTSEVDLPFELEDVSPSDFNRPAVLQASIEVPRHPDVAFTTDAMPSHSEGDGGDGDEESNDKEASTPFSAIKQSPPASDFGEDELLGSQVMESLSEDAVGNWRLFGDIAGPKLSISPALPPSPNEDVVAVFPPLEDLLQPSSLTIGYTTRDDLQSSEHGLAERSSAPPELAVDGAESEKPPSSFYATTSMIPERVDENEMDVDTEHPNFATADLHEPILWSSTYFTQPQEALPIVDGSSNVQHLATAPVLPYRTAQEFGSMGYNEFEGIPQFVVDQAHASPQGVENSSTDPGFTSQLAFQDWSNYNFPLLSVGQGSFQPDYDGFLPADSSANEPAFLDTTSPSFGLVASVLSSPILGHPSYDQLMPTTVDVPMDETVTALAQFNWLGEYHGPDMSEGEMNALLQTIGVPGVPVASSTTSRTGDAQTAAPYPPNDVGSSDSLQAAKTVDASSASDPNSFEPRPADIASSEEVLGDNDLSDADAEGEPDEEFMAETGSPFDEEEDEHDSTGQSSDDASSENDSNNIGRQDNDTGSGEDDEEEEQSGYSSFDEDIVALERANAYLLPNTPTDQRAFRPIPRRSGLARQSSASQTAVHVGVANPTTKRAPATFVGIADLEEDLDARDRELGDRPIKANRRIRNTADVFQAMLISASGAKAEVPVSSLRSTQSTPPTDLTTVTANFPSLTSSESSSSSIFSAAGAPTTAGFAGYTPGRVPILWKQESVAVEDNRDPDGLLALLASAAGF